MRLIDSLLEYIIQVPRITLLTNKKYA